MNALGVDVGGTFAKLGLVTPRGRLLQSARIATEPEKGPADFVRRVKAATQDWSYGRMGLALAGGVDHEKGSLLFVPNLPGWAGYSFKKAFKGVVVENDANAAAWGVYALTGRKTPHAVALTLGTGVGGGLIFDGRLHRGATGSAGELGHMVIEVGGALCACGRRGCLEAYCGTYAIQRLAGSQTTPQELAAAAEAGDAAALAVWNEVGTRLGEGVANLVLSCDPGTVFLLGGVARAGALLLDPVRRVLAAQPFRRPFERLRLLAPAERDWGTLGAALLALEGGGR